MEAERRYREGHIDFDPFALGKQYIERGIALQPDSRLRKSTGSCWTVWKPTETWVRSCVGEAVQEDLLKNSTDEIACTCCRC